MEVITSYHCGEIKYMTQLFEKMGKNSLCTVGHGFKKNSFRILIGCVALSTLISVTDVFAINPDWEFASYTLNSGGVGFSTVIVEVTDPAANINPGLIDSISITITSTVDPNGISLTLIETGVDEGVFRNSNLIFMTGNDLFTVAQTVTILVADPTFASNGMVDTISDVLIISSSDDVGFTPTLIETTDDSGIFEATIHFGDNTDSGTNTIEAKGGDVLSSVDLQTAEFANGLVIPNPDKSVGAIQAETGSNVVTATYQGDSSSIDIQDSGVPGRGGGGVIRPGLVLNFVVGFVGGSNVWEPPTIGKNLDQSKQLVENGFCIDADCITVTKLFHEEFKLYEMMTGTHTLTTTIYCAQGVVHCKYTAIGIMSYDKDMNDTLWKIEMIGDDRGNWTPIIDDPEGFLGEVTVQVQVVSNKFLLVSYTIEFKNKETPPMKVGVQLRDDKNGVRNFYFNEGVKFHDADAYPYVEAFYEDPVKVEPLCLNENSNKRNTCAFAKVQDWATQNAEDALNDILNGDYIFDEYNRFHPYVWK